MPITRSVTFDDPQEIARDIRAMSGMAFLQRLIAQRTRVPIATTLGFQIAEVGEGRAVFTAEAGPWCYNPIGTVHGGWYGAVLDAPLGVSLHTLLPAGGGYTTLEYKVNLVKAVKPDTGPLTASARVVHKGRTTAVTEARLEDARGALYAYASATQLILER
jgi:uncharacterized protein (TIGR00369 family)